MTSKLIHAVTGKVTVQMTGKAIARHGQFCHAVSTKKC